MTHPRVDVTSCPDCESDRRQFLKHVGASAAALTMGAWAAPHATAAPTPSSAAETAVKALYDKLSDEQKKVICFGWEHQDPKRGLLRTHVSNNWHITAPQINSNFFTNEQRGIIYDVFKGLFQPDWVKKIEKQLRDDSGGVWGAAQNIAIFGKPGDGKFELVMTGRHLTVRADGDSEAHVAFGGPIFHGHAASGFTEKVGHPGNIFWHQAQVANKLYQILSGKQQKDSLVEKLPRESAIAFGGKTGLPCSDLSKDQKEQLTKVLSNLLEPYRKEDQDEAMACVTSMGGLDKCTLTFYEEGDKGNDKEWDCWRLEGPSLVWYFRGDPHVHIWVNIADSADVKLNAIG